MTRGYSQNGTKWKPEKGIPGSNRWCSGRCARLPRTSPPPVRWRSFSLFFLPSAYCAHTERSANFSHVSIPAGSLGCSSVCVCVGGGGLRGTNTPVFSSQYKTLLSTHSLKWAQDHKLCLQLQIGRGSFGIANLAQNGAIGLSIARCHQLHYIRTSQHMCTYINTTNTQSVLTMW